MPKHFHTIVIGGGCLGVATAVSLARRRTVDGREPVCLIEKAVLGAGLSSRHSAIIRSANASATAARLAARSTELWKDPPIFGGSRFRGSDRARSGSAGARQPSAQQIPGMIWLRRCVRMESISTPSIAPKRAG